MAEAMFKPPISLDLNDSNIAETYKKWKRLVEIYLKASGATEKSKDVQAAIILHCAGSHK